LRRAHNGNRVDSALDVQAFHRIGNRIEIDH
jgi:hypothetical protein